MHASFVRWPVAKRRPLLWSGVFALLCASLWAVGFVRFVSQIPSGATDPKVDTDAIVVLTGGSERLKTGLRLLAEDRAEKLFVSGVHHGTDVAELLRVARQAPEEVDCCVVLGYRADDTLGNARETADWMTSQGYTSLRLVTANYHMQRSLREFRRLMPDVTIIPHPVIPAHVKQRDWWRYPGTTRLFVREYNKLLLALLQRPFG